ncbi:uncharacterized protein TM35_000222610 [Trypanosoma theileri]|uniref:Uncharacterized protein n=1 Tax=Trypanosoma theileri TaxID=67003 RepID=A0A1X0NRY5_9TRYP|nr:uncharacterized protein TM35_000222610 [Trypanosoma theileri]ORC87462.1 hypothetical protein TM35_000222610 [Trypanosoma theileri]
MRPARLLAFPQRLSGTVVSWHPFERRGVIHCVENGKEYIIPNARAFETILPTRLRYLKGAKVEFEVLRDAQEVDRVITRSRLDNITANSYKQRTPVDFLAGFRLAPPQEGDKTSKVSELKSEETKSLNASLSSNQFIAGHITVDLSTVVDPEVGNSTAGAEEDVYTVDTVEGGVPPPKSVKDLRNPAVLDNETMKFLRLRQRIGDELKVKEVLKKQQEEEEAKQKANQRKVLSTQQTGVVLTWSSLHRSGVLLENTTTLPKCTSAEEMKNVCIIRNVDAFDTALPTSLNLVGRVVTFAKVIYNSQPSSVFAENITVHGEIHFDDDLTAAQEAKSKEAAAEEHAKRAKQLGTQFEEENYDNEPLPSVPLYGVVTRWSGGQGIVETGSRRLYYIQSAAEFKQLVDHTSYSIRGAVVSFRVDPLNRRNAKDVDVLSLATRDFSTVMPMLKRSDGAVASLSTSSSVAGGLNNENPKKEEKEFTNDDLTWVHGMMITWSPSEGQGVIQGDDDERYVLRDAEEHVVDYKTRKSLLKKGRQVKFTPFGGTGRLACNVVLLDTEADAALLAEAELQTQQEEVRIAEGHSEEAIASPMSTAYWITRMDRAGYDTTEVKQMQNKAITFEDDDDDESNDKLLDSEDLFKKDHWFNDPRKNMRLPNSDMTAGNLALIGPASMMNIAMKAHDPKKLEKMKNKYYNRLTEPMKEFAWKQAKELAPKYEKRVKEAREKGDEPRFSFY